MFQYTSQEEAYYKQLWASIDQQGLGFVEAKSTVQFFKKSRLSVEILKGMWIAGVKNQEGKLFYSDFATIMRLIAYCQNGFEFNEQLLNQNILVPLPVLDGIQVPQQQQSISKPLQQQFNNIQLQSNLLPQSNYFQTQPVQNTSQISLQISIDPKLDLQKYDLPDDQYYKYELTYNQQDKSKQGFIQSDQVQSFLQKSQLPSQTLNQLLNLVDIGQKGHLLKNEFIIAIHLVALFKKDIPLPQTLPESLLKLTIKDQMCSQIRLKSQTMQSVPSVIVTQSQRQGTQNELQGLNQQAYFLQNKLSNQTQLIQFANSLDQQKQIIEDKKKDIEFLNQTIQKLQCIYDFLKTEEVELQEQISLLNIQQVQKKDQMNILQESNQNQLQTNQNLQKPWFEHQQQNDQQENQPPTKMTEFQTIHIEDDYDYSKYRAQKDRVVFGVYQSTENLPWE